MVYREADEFDLESIENFVRLAIHPAFNHPSLTPEQCAENEWVVNVSRQSCKNALN